MIVGEFNAKLVEVAQGHLGLREVGHNSGPVIDEWLADVGQKPGASWCAAAVHGCAWEAATALNLPNPCPRTASVLKLWELLVKARVALPFPGCIYFVEHAGGLGHAGIVEVVAPNGMLDELSGNTNAAGHRDGNAFERHSWNWRDGKAHGGRLLGFADLELALLDHLTAGLPPSPF
jgi:hypothetical protein